jgi:hypothetical protein
MRACPFRDQELVECAHAYTRHPVVNKLNFIILLISGPAISRLSLALSLLFLDSTPFLTLYHLFAPSTPFRQLLDNVPCL